MNNIGQRMKELREKAHLSQAEVAKMCGTSQTTVGKMELGRVRPSVELLVKLADYYDVSMDYLCCRTDQPQGRLYECKPKIRASGEDMRQFIEMCFDPSSHFNTKLKETLLQMMEEST